MTHAVPYVYRLEHNITEQFYIGYREANIVNSSEDLGGVYLASSKYIDELGFKNFTTQVLAEFINPNNIEAGRDAYWFEQEVIAEYIDNPLCLNKYYIKRNGQREFRNRSKASDETKAKMSDAHTLRYNDPEAREKQCVVMNSPEVRTKLDASLKIARAKPEYREKQRDSHLGKEIPQDQRDKIGKKNKESWEDPEYKAKMKIAFNTPERKAKFQQSRNSHFKLISPKGIEHINKGINKFCKLFKLNQYSITRLLRGDISEYLGWSGNFI